MNPESTNQDLWYRQSAETWKQALPLGNGRLGAMVFGGVGIERVGLNEDSVWYGGPRSRLNPDAAIHLADVRAHVVAGRIAEAETLAMLTLAGVPEHPSHYLPVGELELVWNGQQGEVTDYLRSLDLPNATCTTEYRLAGTLYRQEVFVSQPDQVVALRLHADRASALSGQIRLTRGRYAGTVSHEGSTVFMDCPGEGPGAVRFVAGFRARVEGGSVRALGETLVIDGANAVTVLVSVATTYRHTDPASACAAALDGAAPWSWDELRSRHTVDHRRLYDRMDLDLGDAGASQLPTDERLARLVAGGSDPGLAQLYFRYGRYLLIASSRPGTLPANLQGLWNDQFLPPWGSKFTININTQMNYWPAEPTNLGECHLPLLDHLERMLPSGRAAARQMYGCRGFVAHHNTDLWGDCAPVDQWVPATIWPLGAAWLCLHLWQHWEYGGNRAFLERAYPLLREAATFFLDFLTEAPDGRLVTNPSVSPENTYLLPSGDQGCLCYGPSMDSQILHALFTAAHAGATELGLDASLSQQFLATRSRLPVPEVGAHGRLLEWSQDYDEVEPGHRHISHLFALHPGDQITVADTPALANACRASLVRRLEQGGGHTGWSKAWIVNLWARLRDGDAAWLNFEELLRHSTMSNLFDHHPPGEMFQIDGNFGGTAGLLELFLQSLRGVIHVLPALPSALPRGCVRGARAQGGFEVSLEWNEGTLQQMSVTSDRGRPCRLAWSEALEVFASGERVATAPGPGWIEFATTPGATYSVRPARESGEPATLRPRP